MIRKSAEGSCESRGDAEVRCSMQVSREQASEMSNNIDSLALIRPSLALLVMVRGEAVLFGLDEMERELANSR